MQQEIPAENPDPKCRQMKQWFKEAPTSSQCSTERVAQESITLALTIGV
jgi:hypothetical protein